MGIIRAVTDAVSGALADQWLEVIEPDQMSDRTVFTAGVQMRQGERNSNTKRTSAVVSNGSVIHLYPNQFMLLVDGGKIVDYTAEEGYYTVKESFNRVRFGGTTPLCPEGLLCQSAGDQGHQVRHHQSGQLL